MDSEDERDVQTRDKRKSLRTRFYSRDCLELRLLEQAEVTASYHLYDVDEYNDVAYCRVR